MTRRVSHADGQRGFTLLEMLVVLAMLGLVAGVALPSLRQTPPGLRIEASARTLCAALRLTRMRAIATNSEMTLMVDADRKTYWSPAVRETALLQEAAIEMAVADSQRHGRNRGGFLFFPGGGSTGGDIGLTLFGRRAAIHVNWLTGEARCVMSQSIFERSGRRFA